MRRVDGDMPTPRAPVLGFVRKLAVDAGESMPASSPFTSSSAYPVKSMFVLSAANSTTNRQTPWHERHRTASRNARTCWLAVVHRPDDARIHTQDSALNKRAQATTQRPHGVQPQARYRRAGNTDGDTDLIASDLALMLRSDATNMEP